MGDSRWSDSDYSARSAHYKSTGKSAFAYSDKVIASGDLKVHPDLDPKKKNTAGVKIRESLDSAEHPESVAIAVFFDVTGSMRKTPKVLRDKLGSLMRLLISKGYIKHPQILTGAIGDANSDYVPLQVGQFESGLEMDDQLSKIVLEGNGGSQIHETYELAHYFMAKYSSLDCLKKRGKKGYFFTIGDEKFYQKIKKEHVLDVIGEEIQSDISTVETIRELQEQYEVFHIIPLQTSNGRNPEIQNLWREVLEERVLLLENADAVCETIAMAIAWNEGAIDDLGAVAKDLIEVGADSKSVRSAVETLSNYVGTRAVAKRSTAVSNLPACSCEAVDAGRV